MAVGPTPTYQSSIWDQCWPWHGLEMQSPEASRVPPAQPGCPAQGANRQVSDTVNCSQRMDPWGWGSQVKAIIVLHIRLSSRTGKGCFSAPLHTPTHDTQSSWERGWRSPFQSHLLCPYCVPLPEGMGPQRGRPCSQRKEKERHTCVEPKDTSSPVQGNTIHAIFE